MRLDVHKYLFHTLLFKDKIETKQIVVEL